MAAPDDGRAADCRGDGHVRHFGRHAAPGEERQHAPQRLHQVHVLALLQVRADRQRAGGRDAAQDPLRRGCEPLRAPVADGPLPGGGGRRIAGDRRGPGVSHRGPPVRAVPAVPGPRPGPLPGGLRREAAAGGPAAGGGAPAALRHAAVPLSLHQRLGAEAGAECGPDRRPGPGERRPLFLQPLPLPVRRGGQPHLHQRPVRTLPGAEGRRAPDLRGQRRPSATDAGGDRRSEAGELHLCGAAGRRPFRQHPLPRQYRASAPDDQGLHRPGAGGGDLLRRQRRQAHQPGSLADLLAEPVSKGAVPGLESAGGGGLSPVRPMRLRHRGAVPAAAGPAAGGCAGAAPQPERGQRPPHSGSAGDPQPPVRGDGPLPGGPEPGPGHHRRLSGGAGPGPADVPGHGTLPQSAVRQGLHGPAADHV